MNKLFASCVIAATFFSTFAIAEDEVQKNYSTSFTSLGALYFSNYLSRSTSIYTGVSLLNGQHESSTSIASYITDLNSGSIFLGLKSYFSEQALSKLPDGKLMGRYFADIAVQHSSTKSSASSNPPNLGFNSSTTTNVLNLSSGYGIVYFLSSNFSLEASAGMGVNFMFGNSSEGTLRDNMIHFPVVATTLTYYW